MDTLESLLHDLDYHIGVAETGTTKGNVKGWITRKHGKSIAKKKKSTGLYSKSLHRWGKAKADDLQLDDDFVKKYPNDWVQMSYRIAYTLAKKRFK